MRGTGGATYCTAGPTMHTKRADSGSERGQCGPSWSYEVQVELRVRAFFAQSVSASAMHRSRWRGIAELSRPGRTGCSSAGRGLAGRSRRCRVHGCCGQPQLVIFFRNTVPAGPICFRRPRELGCGCGAVSAEYVGWDGVRDTGVNMLGRSRISHAARVADVRGCRGYSLSHARRIDYKAVAASKWLFEQRPESVDETCLNITGRTVCHSSRRRNHDRH
jgi:hypothetical protein